MSVERERARELLGLKPGASAQEIKAAYRDLAKVWHPDRFSHDPRLQQKAQDKLKEINEAYEALTSASFTGSRTAGRGASKPATHDAPQQPAPSSGGRGLWTALILIACFASFAFFLTIRLRQEREGNDAGQLSVAPTTPPVTDEESERKEAATNRPERKSVERQKPSASVSTSGATEPSPPAVRALPTATVTIDPTTGLLATSACPVKTRMTYVAGQEPRQYCSADHRPPPPASDASSDSKNKSRLKSVVNRMAAPARWLKNKSRELGEPND
jgi:hypothetical protein